MADIAGKGSSNWVSAIIAGAGKGKRLEVGYNKQFAPLAGRPMLTHTLVAAGSCQDIDEIVVVVGEGEEEQVRHQILEKYGQVDMSESGGWRQKVSAVVAGGARRQDSVFAGLKVIRPEAEIVVVHDGARPLASPELFSQVIGAARQNGAAIAAVPVKDTIKAAARLEGSVKVGTTVPREQLWAAQTPQAFQRELLWRAYEQCQREGIEITDDAAAVERLGVSVDLVMGSYKNVKVTTPEDVILAEALMKGQAPGYDLRIGIGYDVHPLVAGRPLILGGIRIPYDRGLAGHSDADVLAHALGDALLGAAGLGDLGRHFPDTDPAYTGISSMILLGQIKEMVQTEGWTVGNIDAVIVAEKPRLAPYVAEMRQALAQVLGTSERQVSIKATTTEGLGFCGRGEGIAAQVVVTIVR